MSDVDRLRAAADRLDGARSHWVRPDDHNLCDCGRGAGYWHWLDVQTAALLRAVDHHYCDDDSCSLWDAAFALADTILDGSQ